jgi:hypothetical protein
MARIVLVLICGVLVFILVSRFAPHFIATYLPGAASGDTTTAPDLTDSTKAASAKKKTTVQKGKSGSASAAASTPTVSEFVNPVPPPPPAGTPGQATQTSGADPRPVARVTAENATLYLTNTSGGPVVGRLTKGAVVEPVFVVSSAGQNWTFVNANDREIAGFLRSENLAKVKAADQSSR